jgi:hypothetical protein
MGKELSAISGQQSAFGDVSLPAICPILRRPFQAAMRRKLAHCFKLNLSCLLNDCKNGTSLEAVSNQRWKLSAISIQQSA